MNQLLVIGGASFDVLHLQEQTASCIGGAGMYTAMAACRSGAQATMFSPRPDPYPDSLRPVVDRLAEWLGPLTPPAKLPHFEISYRGGKTEYLKASIGAEANLSPPTLPADLSKYDIVHVCPLDDAALQMSFIQTCRQRGAAKISAGTGLFNVGRQTEAVRAVAEEADYFFMNDQEAQILFGSLEAAGARAGKILYVTLGAQGVCIIQGITPTMIPAAPAAEVDPTGAGDTFCGATLAHLLQKKHPVMAARHAIALAAEMIEQVGPAALLADEPPPEASRDPRVQLNEGQLQKIAAMIANIPEAAPFPFVSPELPPVGHPQALDYFFAATLQQFGFWTANGDRYERPLLAAIGGAEKKGSDYLWDAFRRRLEIDPAFCSPERQANISREELLAVFRADNGRDPMPALDLHLNQARQYGRDMLALQLRPEDLLQQALASDQPLQTFLAELDHIGGYKEDPLRKKSSLLALILNQRPERFLPLRSDEQVAPVIDYHLMRSCLRVGLIDVLDEALKGKLLARQIIAPAEEWAVRHAAFQAIERIVTLSGKSPGAVDWFFFGARKRCPEMSEPECHLCQLDPICAHRKELFQPVMRTTYY